MNIIKIVEHLSAIIKFKRCLFSYVVVPCLMIIFVNYVKKKDIKIVIIYYLMFQFKNTDTTRI